MPRPTVQSNPTLQTDTHFGHLIITDSFLCPWGKKALRFSINSTHLIWTLSMAPLSICFNRVLTVTVHVWCRARELRQCQWKSCSHGKASNNFDQACIFCLFCYSWGKQFKTWSLNFSRFRMFLKSVFHAPFHNFCVYFHGVPQIWCRRLIISF